MRLNSDSKYIISSEESTRISILKVWLTILVVFIHSYSEEINIVGDNIVLDIPVWLDWIKYIISRVIARCAVPAFFFISAVLLYKKEFLWKKNIKKKLFTLVIPYVILNSFWILFYFTAQHINAVSVYFSNPDNIIANWGAYEWIMAYTKTPLVYPLWFLRDLFVLNLLAKVIKAAIDKFPRLMLIVLAVLFIAGAEVRFVYMSIVFFSLGYYFVKYDLHFSDIDKLNKWVLAAVYIVTVVLACLTRHTELGYLFINLTIVPGILFFISMATRIKSESLKDKIVWVSKYSFCIYLFHEMNLFILKKLLGKLLPTDAFFQTIQYFGIPVIIIVFCIVLSEVLKKFLPKVFALLTGNRTV